MTRFLQFSAGVACLALAWCAGAIGWTAYELPSVADAAIAREGDRTRALIVVEALELRRLASEDVIPLIDARSGQALTEVRELVNPIYKLADKLESDANARTSDALAIVKDAAALTVTEMQGLRADLKPTLANAALLTDEAHQFLDEHYYDLSASVQSGTVAITSVGRMGDEWAKAAPKVTESVVGIGHSADGIAADVHTATSDFVKPRSTWQKVKSALLDVGRIAARFM